MECPLLTENMSLSRSLRVPVSFAINSVVLMDLVDANYRFLWVDVGGDGAMSDGQIFNNSDLKECLEDDSIPDPDPLPYDDEDTPYFLLGMMLSRLKLS